MKHEIINKLIKDNKLISYLEVGYGDGHNFKKINCEFKFACDPNYKGSDDISVLDSDDFFRANKEEFDLIFIDGLHHSDQVRKDIISSMKNLSEDGFIVLHDTIPHSEEMQLVPRKTKQWTGDVWKAAVGLLIEYPELEIYTHRSDYGVTIIKPQGKKVKKHFDKIIMSYEAFKKNEVELLNIID